MLRETSRAMFGFDTASPAAKSDRSLMPDSPKAASKADSNSGRVDEQPIVPDQDWFFVNIYQEFEQLRSVGLSQSDFIELVNLKDQKKRSICTSSFLDGALATMHQVN